MWPTGETQMPAPGRTSVLIRVETSVLAEIKEAVKWARARQDRRMGHCWWTAGELTHSQSEGWSGGLLLLAREAQRARGHPISLPDGGRSGKPGRIRTGKPAGPGAG